MKKVMFLLLMLAMYLPAQTKGVYVSGVTVWSDSLKTYGSGSASDSVFIVNLGYAFEYPNVTITDTGSTITDSIQVFKGIITYDNAVDKTPLDTIWTTKPLPVYDYGWNIDTTLIGAGQTKTYTILDYNIYLLKVLRMNAKVTQKNKTDIIIEATKKRGY